MSISYDQTNIIIVNMKIVRRLLVSLAVFIFIACGDTSREELTEVVEIDANVAITYESDVKPIITEYCIRCHTNPPKFNAPFSLEGFNLVNNRAERVNLRIANGTMPPNGAIPAAEREIIRRWIEDGQLEK